MTTEPDDLTLGADSEPNSVALGDPFDLGDTLAADGSPSTLDEIDDAGTDPNAQIAESSASDDARPRSRSRRLLAGAAIAAAAVITISAAVIAVEQHRQTDQIEHQTCYARASALAQLATVEIAKGSPNPPDPGVVVLFCDQQAGYSH